ncbi:MAG: Nuclease-related domain protein [Pelotomaculum sp. PtaB.Bin104]|nr:MAG: Nuclease-related domain protein [Pelotomaculum sp. PtaB.Bin104]
MADTLRWPSSLEKQANNLKRREAKANSVPLKFLILGLLAGVVIFIFAQQYMGDTTLGLFLSLSWISIVIIIAFGRKLLSINFESNKLQKGFTGELIVAEELDRHPDGWFIINDMVINGSQIDHIAVGPSGLYCLETKNWNNAGCDENGVWFRFHLGHWVPLDKNPAEQNYHHVLSLKRFLNEKSGLGNIRIVSIVVLANPTGKFNIKSKIVQPGDTIICLPSELQQLLANSGRTVLPPDTVKKIAQTILGR